MASVKVKNPRDPREVDRAIKKFKRKIEKEGIMKDLKKNRFYMKPSVKKRHKREMAEKRRRKAIKRQRKY